MKVLEYIKKTYYLPILAFILIVSAFFVNTPKEVIIGLKNIILSSSILTTDYIEVGTLGSTLLNAGLVLILNLVIIRLLDLRMSGLIYAAVYMILGYSFFGKNVLNSLPIYFGVFLYSKINKIPTRNLIIPLLFSSGISPLVSYIMFGFDIKLYISIPLGLLSGISAGMIVPAMSSHTIKFHQGYNLFNVGFSLGIIAILFNGILSLFGYETDKITILSDEYSTILYVILFSFSLCLIIISILTNPKAIKMMPTLFKRSGRLVSDYIRDYGISLVLLNQAGIIIIQGIICLIFKVNLNGVVFGTIISVCGFAGAGMHIKNTSIIMLGAIIMSLIVGSDISQTSIIIGILFSVALSPVAGRYGIFIGILTGALHMAILPLCLSFQGGYDLYNNGFCAGFVACIVITITEAFKKEE